MRTAKRSVFRGGWRVAVWGILLLPGVAWGAGPSVAATEFGMSPAEEGRKPVHLFTLVNRSGASVSVMDWGATIVSIDVPDRDGRLDDIVLGFDTFDPYPRQSPYFGATIGRVGNRIARAAFALNGKTYPLAANDGPNSLHGGVRGFDKRMWKGKVISQDPPTVRFDRRSPDGEEGYPGNLDVSVEFRWTDKDELQISYGARTDRDTVVNLTNHSYFNLTGRANGTIRDHELSIRAAHYTPVDETLIPTGRIAPVEGTPFDFRKPTPIGLCLNETGGSPIGYDHNYVLDPAPFAVPAVTVSEPKTGRWMKVYTDQPGVQFYSGNFLDGTVKGKGGVSYPRYTALVLETQHFPDSPNQPAFPSIVLKPGETWHSRTVYAFGPTSATEKGK